MRLEEAISEGIRNAMKAQDKVRMATLRNVKKYILEARSAAAGITELSDAEVVKIIRKLSKQGLDSAEIYRTQGRQELYDEEMAQVHVLKEFLPQQMDDVALTAAVRGIIAAAGAASLKDMGRVMGIASKELAGKAEGKDISDKVKELLSQEA